MLNHSYENEFNLHVNENLLAHERMSTRTRFENEANFNSEEEKGRRNSLPEVRISKKIACVSF